MMGAEAQRGAVTVGHLSAGGTCPAQPTEGLGQIMLEGTADGFVRLLRHLDCPQ